MLLTIAWKLCAFVLLLCASPLIWLWLIVDYPRLKRAALDIEPLDIPPARTPIERMIGVAREILFIVALPLIALMGMFMCVLAPEPNETESWD